MTPIDPTAAVGIVGAGTMGSGIAQVAAVAGHEVRIYDAQQGAATRAVGTIAASLARAAAKGRLSHDAATAATDRVHAVRSVADLGGCELVIEAVVEDLGVKRSLFADLEQVCPIEAILASNMSSLSISDVAADLHRPGRVAGLHFFNPAPVLPLVEVIAGEHSDPKVLDVLVATAQAWGKTPVRAASTPGFIVNRVARPFYGEAFRLLESGILDAATIDAMLHESGGFRMGPFELADLIGHDVNLAVSRSVWEAFGRDARFTPSALQQRLVDEGRLGRKTGAGIYPADRPAPAASVPSTGRGGDNDAHGRLAAGPDDMSWQLTAGDVVIRPTDGRTAAQHTADGAHTVVLADLALDYAKASRIGIAAPPAATTHQVESAIAALTDLGYQVSVLPDTPGLVVARTVAMLAAFAADAVDSAVATADDVDTAMRLGVNYPRGPYAWGEALGWSWVTGVLDALADAEDPQRYRVSPALRARAADTPARRAAAAMWADDAASQALGMTIEQVSPGQAEVSMRVRDDMVNGHGICHGGLIFALADTAFAFACNSYNRRTVAHSCDITFVAPARQGEQLLARASERHREGRNGIYDVTVVRRSPGGTADDLIAEFRGRCREIPGTLVDEEAHR